MCTLYSGEYVCACRTRVGYLSGVVAFSCVSPFKTSIKAHYTQAHYTTQHGASVKLLCCSEIMAANLQTDKHWNKLCTQSLMPLTRVGCRDSSRDIGSATTDNLLSLELLYHKSVACNRYLAYIAFITEILGQTVTIIGCN